MTTTRRDADFSDPGSPSPTLRGGARAQETRAVGGRGRATRGASVGAGLEQLLPSFGLSGLIEQLGAPEDPLGLREAVVQRLRQTYRLEPVDPLLPQVTARVARLLSTSVVNGRREARRRRERGGTGRPGTPGRSRAILERAIDESVADLERRRRAGLDRSPGAGAAFDRFHALPEPVRAAFFVVFLEGAHPEELARERGTDLSRVGRELRSAVEALLGGRPSGEGSSSERGDTGVAGGRA